MSRQRREAEAALPAALGAKGAFTAALLGWWADNGRQFPWRVDRTPYRVLVSELLLKRTTSTAAARVFLEFLERYPDVRSLASADRLGLEALFSKVGLQKQRAVSALRMARHICGELGGELPVDYGVLRRIPGVGDYTACAVLSFGFGVPVAAVDSNVVRILTRVFESYLGTDASKGTIRALAQAVLPENGHEAFNYALLDLGATVCRYRYERHGVCPLKPMCDRLLRTCP